MNAQHVLVLVGVAVVSNLISEYLKAQLKLRAQPGTVYNDYGV